MGEQIHPSTRHLQSLLGLIGRLATDLVPHFTAFQFQVGSFLHQHVNTMTMKWSWTGGQTVEGTLSGIVFSQETLPDETPEELYLVLTNKGKGRGIQSTASHNVPICSNTATLVEATSLIAPRLPLQVEPLQARIRAIASAYQTYADTHKQLLEATEMANCFYKGTKRMMRLAWMVTNAEGSTEEGVEGNAFEVILANSQVWGRPVPVPILCLGIEVYRIGIVTASIMNEPKAKKSPPPPDGPVLQV